MRCAPFALLVLLAGCGFQPRGALPGDGAGFGIDGAGRALATALRAEAPAFGLTPETDAGDRLRVLQERFHERVAAIGQSGRELERELVYEVLFQIDRGDVNGEPQRLTLARLYRRSGARELGRVGEDDLLRDELRREMGRRLLRRIAAGGR